MSTPAPIIDLAIAWTWQYDREFVDIIEEKAGNEDVSTYVIRRENRDETLAQLKSDAVQFRYFLDRASDEDESFHPLHRYLAQRPSCRLINPHALQQWSADKATMHLEFLARGIRVPYTIIVSPYSHRKELELSLTELASLGRPFIIKPANTTGGGIGVVRGAETLKDILDARQHHQGDKYLLQETIKPVYFSEQRAWFRVLYAFGTILPCWWDDQTHLYETVSAEEEELFDLTPLRTITASIRDITALDFFSTELVCTEKDSFVAVDYVNEICDMRLQSLHRDGVPDGIVHEVAHALVRFIKSG